MEGGPKARIGSDGNFRLPRDFGREKGLDWISRRWSVSRCSSGCGLLVKGDCSARVGNHVIGAFSTAKGEARFITELVREGEILILRGTHIEGEATLRESLQAARQFGRAQGAKKVIIEGGRRTTGARPATYREP
jgi:hypothetical protein